MQEEVENRTVTLVISATKLTGRVLKAAVAKFLAHQKAKIAEKKRAGPVKPTGKQTVKQLVGQNQGVANIEISDKNIKDFDRVARKYGVDYAVKKDKTLSPPKYMVFFKARDADALTAAFEEYTRNTARKRQKPSLIQHLHDIQAAKDIIKPAVKHKDKDRLKEITDSIENGIKELFESEKYKNYLRTMSRFHKYSVNNTMLIYMQKPDATVVAGFNKWRDQFGRNVLKGEKGIKIIAPTPYKKKIEEAKLDPDTKLPMLDADGKAIMEEKEIKIPMYKPVTVFDVSLTEGKPLPQLAADLTGNVQNYEVFMEAVKRSAPVPVFLENMTGMDGYYDDENRRIAVRTGMSEVQTVCAAIHEIAHSLLHGRDDVGEKYQVIELFEEPALYSNGRIDRERLPEGLYAYDLRGSDDDPGLPVTIQEHVVVNHAATVITATPIDLTRWARTG